MSAAAAIASNLGVPITHIAEQLERLRSAQRSWQLTSLSQRLQIMRRFRHLLAEGGENLASLVPPTLSRTIADTLSAEVLPLAEAVRFLELEAAKILSLRAPTGRARPLWLGGVHLRIQRDPWGIVLVIGPANYPIFLPAVQAVQALVAGNAVCWKPGAGGRPVAEAVAGILSRAGLPGNLLLVTDETADTAQRLIDAGVDKIILTGSEASGRAVLKAASEKLTPASVELSGCDAMFVLADANLGRSVDALLFGLRLNGSATCIAPRRIFVASSQAPAFTHELSKKIASVSPVQLDARSLGLTNKLVLDALSKGAEILFDGRHSEHALGPIVLNDVRPDMDVMRTDVFAPIVGLCRFDTEGEALALASECPYALGATVFGPEERALKFARQVTGGIVVINDMIAATADPRISFGGRNASGFGKSRGAEGLLEMTVSKTLVLQKSRRLRHLEAPHANAQAIFAGALKALHGRGFGFRASSLLALGQKLARKSEPRNT